MKTVIFLLGLVALTGATSTLNLDRSPFSKNLVDTIALQMTTGGSVDDILDLLDQVRNEIINEQIAADDAHTTYQNKCNSDIADYESKIETAENDIETAEAGLAEQRPKRDRLAGEISDAESQLATAEEELDEATEIRNEQHAEYLTHKEELEAALDIFGRARAVLSEAFGKNGAFLQTSAGATVSAQFKNAKIMKKYEPFTRILAQITASEKFTQEGIDRVLSLLDQLSSNAQETLNSENSIETARQEAFDEFEAEWTAKITGLNQLLSGLRTEYQQTLDKIDTLEKNLADAEGRLERNTKALAARIADCDAEQEEYTRETEQRNSDLSVIDEVEELIRTRIQDFTTYISETRDNVDIQ